jgi:hypothetical protein
MNTSFQRLVMLVLGGIWCALIVMRIVATEEVQEVPLQFRTGRPAAAPTGSTSVADPWQVKPLNVQAKSIPSDPQKNIFAPLEASSLPSARPAVTTRAKKMASPAPPPSVAAAPAIPTGPSPEELAAQEARRQEELRVTQLRQQEELKLKQLREQMNQYRYLGYLSQQGVQKAFVGKGKEIYIIRRGDKLDGKFLVASIDPAIVKLREPTTSIEASLELKKDGDHGPS